MGRPESAYYSHMKFDPEHSRAVQRFYPSMLFGCEPVLDSLSDARRYRGWLAELALPHLGDDPIAVRELSLPCEVLAVARTQLGE